MAQRDALLALRSWLNHRILGQEALVDRLLIALLSDGHLLVEGAPGLAKTRAIKDLALGVEGSFHRIQFTPDLMPSDIVGSEILAESRQFKFMKGPLFANIVLADEINRTPPKTQSALLEAMQERSVTVAGQHYPLPSPFFVLATQNPIEQEGTYMLPEAQVDRFMFKLKVGYPSLDEEHIVMKRMARTDPDLGIEAVLSIEDLMEMRRALEDVFIDGKVERYILRLVDATRHPDKYGLDFSRYVRFGASPRASIYLSLAARGHALMLGRDYVTPQDVKDVSHDILRHRMAISYRAEAESITSDDLLDQILKSVPASE